MDKISGLKNVERLIERSMYAMRWIMAPIYLGMGLALLTLGLKFFKELFSFMPSVFSSSDSEVILNLLTLIDLTLIGNLILIVMFTGYENFVSSLDLCDTTEKLDWLGTHDFGSLKTKVAASIVAISSIHLLKVFMNLQDHQGDKLLWYLGFHLTFVVSAVLMGYQDRSSKQSKGVKHC